MTTSTSKILNCLDIQEKIEGETENLKQVKKLLKHLKKASEIDVFFEIKGHRYGKLSYEVHHFYYVKEHLKPILKLD